jgi:hypothetical protein
MFQSPWDIKRRTLKLPNLSKEGNKWLGEVAYVDIRRSAVK